MNKGSLRKVSACFIRIHSNGHYFTFLSSSTFNYSSAKKLVWSFINGIPHLFLIGIFTHKKPYVKVIPEESSYFKEGSDEQCHHQFTQRPYLLKWKLIVVINSNIPNISTCMTIFLAKIVLCAFVRVVWSILYNLRKSIIIFQN